MKVNNDSRITTQIAINYIQSLSETIKKAYKEMLSESIKTGLRKAKKEK